MKPHPPLNHKVGERVASATRTNQKHSSAALHSAGKMIGGFSSAQTHPFSNFHSERIRPFSGLDGMRSSHLTNGKNKLTLAGLAAGKNNLTDQTTSAACTIL